MKTFKLTVFLFVVLTSFNAIAGGSYNKQKDIVDTKAKLAAILTYHVVSGKVKAKDVVKLSSATTVQGSDVSIMIKDGGVILNENSNVVNTDIKTSNGIIHVIDTVILPPSS